MVKLEYNQIIQKKTIIMDGDPYLVLSSAVSKKDRQKASNAVKMKNLRTQGVVDRTFHQADVLEEANIEKKGVKYLYNNRGEYFFCEPDNPRARFTLSGDVLGTGKQFLKENSIVESLVFEDEIMSVLIPIKVELKVTETSPAVKGNTSSGATKEVVLETGVVIQAPQFINEGDTLSVNTESGQYSERTEKA